MRGCTFLLLLLLLEVAPTWQDLAAQPDAVQGPSRGLRGGSPGNAPFVAKKTSFFHRVQNAAIKQLGPSSGLSAGVCI